MGKSLTYQQLEQRIEELERMVSYQGVPAVIEAVSENSFSQLFESAPVPMGYAIEKEGYWGTTWNDAWYETFLYTLEEAHGKSGNEIGLWVDPAERKHLVESAKTQNFVADFDALLKRKHGKILNCSLFGRFIRKAEHKVLMIAYLDVTEKKLAEREVAYLRAYLANIIDSMPSAIIGVNSDCVITQWNQHAADITGLSSERAIGLLFAEAFPRLKNRVGLIETTITTQAQHVEHKHLYELDDEPRYEDITIYPLMMGEEKGAVIRIDEITEKVRMEEMIIQSEKMMTVGGLAAGIAHEINNPLAGMVQAAGVIRTRLFDPALPGNVKAAQATGLDLQILDDYIQQRSIPQLMDTIQGSGQRISEIISNMLNFSANNLASESSHDINQLLDKTLELALTDFDLKKHYDFRAINLSKEYTASLPLILCDGSKIQQVLLNLLRNAAQAMQEDETSNPSLTLRTYLDESGQFLYIDIEDNGPGMDDSTRKRIFEPFFTTKPVGIGTGLGLSISYFIVTEEHGGKMEVESQLGKGTVFKIALPVPSAK